ncbi:MAG: DUF4372 domain-containing protein [Bdellovibrionales bacterium]|nr:DUF4372 domain-containing protein [Bdellovibrionales bacterium]
MIEKFDPLVQKWKIDRGVRTFSTWEMTQALLSCFVMRLGSFREVEAALKIPDSTFGDALRDRHFGFFKNSAILFSSRFAVEQKVENSKKAIREILAIDSSEVRVHGSLFGEPGWKQKYTIGHSSGKNSRRFGMSTANGLMISRLRRADLATPRSASNFAFYL